jgi:hypothetical protein
MRSAIKIVGGIFAVLILGPVTLFALYAGASEVSYYLVYAKRPILSAMSSAPGITSWVDDSRPAKEALLQRVPIGSRASRVTAAFLAEGFQCSGDGSSGRDVKCFTDVQHLFIRTFWSVRLNFDEASRLTDAKIGLRTLSF